MIPSRVIGGVSGIVFGAFLIGLTFTLSEAFWVLMIYVLIFLGVGIGILLNNKEDKIEEIKIKKSIKTKRSSK